MNKGRLISIASHSLPLLLYALAAGSGWNVGTGGGPARGGYLDVTGPDEATLLWQGGAASVISWQPVVDGNTTVAARCADISDVLHGTLIYAYDIRDGTELWSTDLPVDFPATDWRNHVSGMFGGTVYASRAGNTNSSYLYALDAADGTVIWRSQDLVDESSTEGVAFSPDGDPVVGCFNSVMRIDSEDGTTVWQTPRNSPTSGGSEVAVRYGKVYGWTAGASGPTISVFDLETGDFLYQSPPLGGGFIQQLAPFAGYDGTVYAPRSQNNPATDYLFALDDTGSELVIKWQSPLGYVPFASFAVVPGDGVYSYGRDGEVVKLDPVSGSVIGSTQDVGAGIGVRMAAEGKGSIFVASEGIVYCFSRFDLTLVWQDTVSGADGPALASDGTMIVCGTGTELRAYQPGLSALPEYGGIGQGLPDQIIMMENPVRGTARFAVDLERTGEVLISLYACDGRMVQTLEPGLSGPGRLHLSLDVSRLSSGFYFAELSVDGVTYGSASLVLLGP
jgi:outer membrane protein assembly factor BamB